MCPIGRTGRRSASHGDWVNEAAADEAEQGVEVRGEDNGRGKHQLAGTGRASVEVVTVHTLNVKNQPVPESCKGCPGVDSLKL